MSSQITASSVEGEEQTKSLPKKIKEWLRRPFSSEVGGEIQALIQSRQEPEEPFSSEEKELIASAIKFSEIDADEVCVPRSEVVYVELDDSFERILETFIKSGFSRLPIRGEDMDDVRGFITLKDVVQWMGRESGFRLKDAIRQCAYVPSSLPIPGVLEQMRQNRVQMAIVVDEYGGTAGLITLKDILAELIGDIEDENEVSSTSILALSGGRYQVDPRVSIDELDEETQKKFAIEISEEYETIGGYVLHKLGRVPESGEKVELKNGAKLLVTDSDGRRINQMLFVPKRKIPKPDDVKSVS